MPSYATSHTTRLTVATLLIGGSMVLPFLPGRYDAFAVTLSGMSQIFGVVGLVLVPFGAVWLAYEIRMHRTGAATPRRKGAGLWIAMVSIGAASLIGLVISIAALANGGISLGIAVIALAMYGVVRLAANALATGRAEVRSFNATPLYLILLPMVAAVAKFVLLPPISEFGRRRAIENSVAMIADIERYRATNGHYPRSLTSLWGDYDPLVIGIERYRYEPSGDAYNLYFEHPSDRLGTREIIMYNPRDEQEMTSHDIDLLTASPAELAVQRGYYAVHDASTPHWKRFLFD